MTKKIVVYSALLVLVFIKTNQAHALEASQIVRYSGSPAVTNITSTTATFDIPYILQAGFAAGEREGTYFEYRKTNQMCIAIYPIPEYCLPKKTDKNLGASDMSRVVTDLVPETAYTVVYKRDNSINCITTPCPSNEFISQPNYFITGPTGTVGIPKFTKNLFLGSRGNNVTQLQEFLITRGFMNGSTSGYFGLKTFRATQQLQRSLGVNPTGYFGPITRLMLNNATTVDTSSIREDTFEGRITAVSTGCLSDGECSVTVDGKKVVTVIGWSQQVNGSVLGSALGDIPVGSYAKVFARKTVDGYTLYGSAQYYVEILANR